MIRSIDIAALRQRLAAPQEFALLDVREQARFGQGHLLAAACLPLGTLEADAPQRLPRLDVSIVVLDDGHADAMLARRGAQRLQALGYTDVAVFEGGVAAWAAGGGEVFRGFNVLGKAFGEWIEHAWSIDALDAAALDRWRRGAQDHLLLDSRPLDEHLRVRVPGALHCPGVELPWRVPGLLQDGHTPVVVHCAGRTRSIIGACLLRLLGLPNPIYALRNGTMGWQLAGLQTASGGDAQLPPPAAQSAAVFGPAVAALRQRCKIARLGAQQWQQMRSDASRTLYAFDIRTRQEYLDGHPAGFLHAPGGQLLQQLDEYAPVRHSRIVVTSDDTLRADAVAVMLWQMGCDDVAVVGTAEAGPLRQGPEPLRRWQAPPGERLVAPAQLASWIAAGQALVLDLSPSPAYRRAHIPGAWFAVRSRLQQALQAVPPAQHIVLTSTDGETAAWAVAADSGLPGHVVALAGGNRAWAASGGPLSAAAPRWADEVDDVYVLPYDYQGDVAAQMQAYIDWELALVAQLRRDGSVRFRPVPAAR